MCGRSSCLTRDRFVLKATPQPSCLHRNLGSVVGGLGTLETLGRLPALPTDAGLSHESDDMFMLTAPSVEVGVSFGGGVGFCCLPKSKAKDKQTKNQLSIKWFGYQWSLISSGHR